MVAIVCLISVLLFFSNSLRDDPLPESAALAPQLSDVELIQGNEKVLNTIEEHEFYEEKELSLKNGENQPMLIELMETKIQ